LSESEGREMNFENATETVLKKFDLCKGDLSLVRLMNESQPIIEENRRKFDYIFVRSTLPNILVIVGVLKETEEAKAKRLEKERMDHIKQIEFEIKREEKKIQNLHNEIWKSQSVISDMQKKLKKN
jgi:uncharacterized protein YlxW (UPF0749 family)